MRRKGQAYAEGRRRSAPQQRPQRGAANRRSHDVRRHPTAGGTPPTGDDGAAYATLLNTVESLQADLQQTITTCHSLRSRTRFSSATTIKRGGGPKREKVAANRTELVEQAKAKIEADRATEALVMKWKVQLD